MDRRVLVLSTYDELLAEIDRLHRQGYRRVGQWSLGQNCSHLSYYFRRILGRPMLKRFLTSQSMGKGGGRTIPASVPPPDTNDEDAVAEARTLISQLNNPTRDLFPSPLFGKLTPDQWRQLHLIHAAHHLSFLIPNED